MVHRLARKNDGELRPGSRFIRANQDKPKLLYAFMMMIKYQFGAQDNFMPCNLEFPGYNIFAGFA